MSEDTVLRSQFRCSGSDQYIQLIDNILQIGENVDIDIDEINYDIRVFDDPNSLRDELRKINQVNNKARKVVLFIVKMRRLHRIFVQLSIQRGRKHETAND